MSDAPFFDDTTPRFGMPFLYSGQSQKEAFVNEALCRADTLLHCAIEGEALAPVQEAENGQAWLVGISATGAFFGREGQIASFQAGNWIFIQPRDGMRIFDRSTASELLFFGKWQKAQCPQEPLGGSTVDGEARVAINGLISALQAIGVFASV